MSNQRQCENMQNRNDEQFDENVLVFDNIFSRGYGFSPQVLTRLPQLSIEAKGLYSYFSSFAGQGGVAFPSTQTILKETNISKNRFYKYRDELEAWGFITVEVENTRHGRRTVYHLPVEPRPTDKVHDLIDAAVQARMHKVNNLPNANVDNSSAPENCGKQSLSGYPQTAGHEPRPQNEDLAYPHPQNQDNPRPQNEDVLNIVKSNKRKVSIDLSSGIVDNPVEADDLNHINKDARIRSLNGAEAPIDTLTSSLMDLDLNENELAAFSELCRLSMKEPDRKRESQAKQLFAKKLGEGFLPSQIISAYERYMGEYKETNSTPRYAMQLDDWLRKESGFKFYVGKPRGKANGLSSVERGRQAKRQQLLASDQDFRDLCNRTTSLFSDWQVAEIGGLSTANSYHDKWKQAVEAEKRYLAEHS